jgi:tetratricopeptide (TPR) repeat protein
MQRLVRFALTEEAFVKTWDDKELAIIETKGFVLGRVSSVESDSARHDRQCVEVTFGNSPESLTFKENWGDRWNLQASAKAIQNGDLICLAQGSSKPTIIRACTDHSAIILISVTHSHSETTSGAAEHREASLSLAGSPREFLLVWDWGKPPVVESELSNCGGLVGIDALAPQYSNEFHSKATRLFNMGVILGDSGEYVQADKTLRKAIRCYEDAYGEDDLQTIAAVDRVALTYKEQQNWVSAELLLTRAVRTRQKIKGPNHLDTLSSVANLLLLHVELAGSSRTGQKAMVDLAERIRSNAAVSVAGTAYMAEFFDSKLMALLLEQRGKDVQITEGVFKASARNRQKGEEIVKLLLEQRGDDV